MAISGPEYEFEFEFEYENHTQIKEIVQKVEEYVNQKELDRSLLGISMLIWEIILITKQTYDLTAEDKKALVKDVLKVIIDKFDMQFESTVIIMIPSLVDKFLEVEDGKLQLVEQEGLGPCGWKIAMCVQNCVVKKHIKETKKENDQEAREEKQAEKEELRALIERHKAEWNDLRLRHRQERKNLWNRTEKNRHKAEGHAMKVRHREEKEAMVAKHRESDLKLAELKREYKTKKKELQTQHKIEWRDFKSKGLTGDEYDKEKTALLVAQNVEMQNFENNYQIRMSKL